MWSTLAREILSIVVMYLLRKAPEVIEAWKKKQAARRQCEKSLTYAGNHHAITKINYKDECRAIRYEMLEKRKVRRSKSSWLNHVKRLF